jgi:hypothetical protein
VTWNVETHADPPLAQTPCAGAGRRGHWAARRETLPKGGGVQPTRSSALAELKGRFKTIQLR